MVAYTSIDTFIDLNSINAGIFSPALYNFAKNQAAMSAGRKFVMKSLTFQNDLGFKEVALIMR